MQIVPGLHLVDDISKGMVNAYLWERPDGGLTLIDSGIPSDGPRILAFTGGFGLDRLNRAIITHGDFDHAGGLPAVQAAARVTVSCHAVERDLLLGRKQRTMSRSWFGKLYTPLAAALGRTVMGFRPIEGVDELLLDKQTLPDGFIVVHTPGHTDGHIALFEPERGILVAGDALRNGKRGLTMPPAMATPDKATARESIRKLAALKGVQVACFGHGPPITENAGDRLQAFAASLPNP